MPPLLLDLDGAYIAGEIVRDQFHLARPRREVVRQAEGYAEQIEHLNRADIFDRNIVNDVVSIRETNGY